MVVTVCFTLALSTVATVFGPNAALWMEAVGCTFVWLIVAVIARRRRREARK